MRRYFAIAHYLTAGGNHGSCSFPVMARDNEQATQLAERKAKTRGRYRIRVYVSGGSDQ